MVKVKSDTEIKANYEASTALVPARFEAGVRSATWQGAAIAGQDLYVAKLQDPSVLARRATNIGKVSDSAWRDQTIAKGRGIIAARMKDASDKQVSGFRPYKAALEAVSLPARTADPMTNLIQRAGAVVQAMADTKKSVG